MMWRTTSMEPAASSRARPFDLDLDISPDGSPMFDYWRFSLYAKGIGALVMSATLFEHAAGILSGRGVLTLANTGWYSFEAKPGDDGAPGTS